MKRIFGRATKFVSIVIVLFILTMLYTEFTNVTVIRGFASGNVTNSNGSILEYSYNGNGFNNNW